MTPIFRINKINNKFVVEIQKKLFKSKYWSIYIKYYATQEPFYFESFDSAMEALLKEIKWKTIENSNYDTTRN